MRTDRRPARARNASVPPSAFVVLDSAQRGPLHRQLYDSIRAAIVSGRLPAGSRLPSSRALAAETGVSRITVTVAFDQLSAEGYVEARPGSGTFVCVGLPDDALHARRQRAHVKPREMPATTAPGTAPRLPTALEQAHVLPMHPTAAIAFITGIPSLDLFPSGLWSKLAARRWRSAVGAEGARLLNYGNPLGYFPLRCAIAQYVAMSRWVRCEPGQVIVTAGAQQALDLICRVLLEPGEAAWLENPAYFGARAAFEAAGATIEPVPVDSEGLDVAAGEALSPTARLAYVSPSHQFPLGVTMSMQRRLALLDWAARAGRGWSRTITTVSFATSAGRCHRCSGWTSIAARVATRMAWAGGCSTSARSARRSAPRSGSGTSSCHPCWSTPSQPRKRQPWGRRHPSTR
jgi:GntR family transcriptional regulator/MocR family aminotransferase